MREDGFMTKTLRGTYAWLAALFSLVIPLSASGQSASAQIGREVAIPVYLQRGVACFRVLDGVRFPAACRTFCDFCRHHVFGPGLIKSYLTLRTGNACVHLWAYHAIAPHVISDTPVVVKIFGIH